MNMMGKSIHIKKSLLEGNFQKIIDGGDPEAEWIIQFTSRPAKEGAYKKHGDIVRFRTKFSDILESDKTGALNCTVMDNTGAWVKLSEENQTIEAAESSEEEKNTNRPISDLLAPIKLKPAEPPPKPKKKEKVLKISRPPSSRDSSSISSSNKLYIAADSVRGEEILVAPKGKSRREDKLKLSKKKELRSDSNPLTGTEPLLPETVSNDDQAIADLMLLGFTEEQVRTALLAHPDNKDAAVNYLLENFQH